MSVDGVEGKIFGGGQVEDFCAGGFQFAAEGFVLRLGGGEIGWVVEAEISPVSDAVGMVPAGGAGRADEDTGERGDHGVSVEEGGG